MLLLLPRFIYYLIRQARKKRQLLHIYLCDNIICIDYCGRYNIRISDRFNTIELRRLTFANV